MKYVFVFVTLCGIVCNPFMTTKCRLYILVLFLLQTLYAVSSETTSVVVGASREELYLPLLVHSRVALLSNHTGVADGEHTLDRLIRLGIQVTAVFSPEHGFRGTAGAGNHVGDSTDEKTGVPILSLYDGKRNYPSESAMQQFDILVVDIQDVGLRFYTYYITMVRLMQICAEYGKQVVIFDRPNPNGHYVDGPILDMRYKSGVGYLPIPVVHGMTLGELALMVNGEHWLEPTGDSASWMECKLTIIPCQGYTHQTHYRLPIAPSPNLQTMLAVYLYPSTCYFEGTPVSLGRGTDKPFLQYGHPKMRYQWSKESRKSLAKNSKSLPLRPARFTPRSCQAAPAPPQQDRLCRGTDLSHITEEQAMNMGLDLRFLIDAYQQMQIDNWFFSPFFEKLIGVDYVRKMIIQGKSAEEIRACWQQDVERFKVQRRPYLLYPE